MDWEVFWWCVVTLLVIGAVIGLMAAIEIGWGGVVIGMIFGVLAAFAAGHAATYADDHDTCDPTVTGC